MIDGIRSWFSPPPPPKPPAPPAQPAVPPPTAPHPGITTPPPGAALPPTHTPQEARDAANRAWSLDFGTANDVPAEDGQLENVANRVHDGAADLEATRQLFANQDQVNAKLGTLTPQQQQQYRALEATLEHNPQSHLALQVMLLEGKLTDTSPGKTTSQPPPQTLLQALNTANTSPTAPHINRDALVGDLVRECAQPSSIHQENKNTCTVSTMQIMTASQRPAEFVRIVAGLAGPQGSVKLADGSNLQRPPGLENDDQSNRTTSSRLWQGSLMNYAGQHADPNAHYDNAADNFQDAQGHVLRSDGMTEDMLSTVASAVTGTHYANADNLNMAANLVGAVDTSLQAHPNTPVRVNMRMGNFNFDGTGGTLKDVTVTRGPNNTYKVRDAQGHTSTMTTQEFARRLNSVAGQTGVNAMTQAHVSDLLMQQVGSELAAGRPASVALWHGSINNKGQGDGSHQVLVTRIDPTTHRVFFTNPHGDEESMPEAEFKARLHGMVYATPPAH